MSKQFFIRIAGELEHATAEAEAAIHKLFAEFGEELKALNTSHSGSLITETLGGATLSNTATPPAPAEAPAEVPAAAAEAPAAPGAGDAAAGADAPAAAPAETGTEEPAKA